MPTTAAPVDAGRLDATEEARLWQALGELRTYLRKLAIVAPNEIRTDAEIVAQGYDEQLKAAKDALKDPLSAIASSLIDGMMMSGQLNRLNQFALDNCGQSI